MIETLQTEAHAGRASAIIEMSFIILCTVAASGIIYV